MRMYNTSVSEVVFVLKVLLIVGRQEWYQDHSLLRQELPQELQIPLFVTVYLPQLRLQYDVSLKL